MYEFDEILDNDSLTPVAENDDTYTYCGEIESADTLQSTLDSVYLEADTIYVIVVAGFTAYDFGEKLKKAI